MSAPSALEAARELLKAYPDGCYLQGSINAALVAHAYIKEHEERGQLLQAASTMKAFAADANLAGCTTAFGVFMRRERAISFVADIIRAALSCSASPEDKQGV